MITQWIASYKKKPLRKKIEDILFVVLLGALIVPASRAQILRVVVATGIIQPKIKQEDAPFLSKEELQWSFYMNGKEQKLSDFKGKVIILNFWATWCPPCVAEFPSFEKLYNSYKEYDEVVFLFANSESPFTVAEFTARHHIKAPITQYQHSPQGQLATRSLPTTYIIDKEGRLVTRKSGAANWNTKKVRRQLDQLIKQQ